MTTSDFRSALRDVLRETVQDIWRGLRTSDRVIMVGQFVAYLFSMTLANSSLSSRVVCELVWLVPAMHWMLILYFIGQGAADRRHAAWLAKHNAEFGRYHDLLRSAAERLHTTPDAVLAVLLDEIGAPRDIAPPQRH